MTKIKFTLAAAAIAAAAISTPALSQMLLPPAPPTQGQVEIHNLITIVMYAAVCRKYPVNSKVGIYLDRWVNEYTSTGRRSQVPFVAILGTRIWRN
jgi:hypothetical protein